jgi:putative endonuclease
MKNYYVYILANKRNGTLYTGVNNNLLRRVIEHKRKIVKGFTEKYNVNKLVWYEQTNDIRLAIQREKQIKKWLRKWKLELIEETNPNWKDLFYEIGGTDEMLKSDFLIGNYNEE